MKKILLLFITSFWAVNTIAQNEIRLNQVGFYPSGEKVAVILSDEVVQFSIVEEGTGTTVYNAQTSAPKTWPYSNETVVLANFTDFTETGSFRISSDGFDDSHPFQIEENVHGELAVAALKYYYFNRASQYLSEEYAGQWMRPMGHPDDRVIVHESAATDERPEGTEISAPKGWYDAGDFNKYVVNSGISTYTLMAAWEHFPEYYDETGLNIPESGNDIPDILDEVQWNLDWMMEMQDPNDGGVYHKLTTKGFAGMVMPHQATATRYVVMKSTAATLNFAAVMATASRVYEDIDPGFSAEALESAEFAWEWANNNPNVYYQQPDDIYTGEYGDGDLSDEFDWAAAELYITTKNDSYWQEFNKNESYLGVPGWPNVRPLAWISLAHHTGGLTEAADPGLIESRIIHQADQFINEVNQSAYGVSMGQEPWHFVWGSNSSALNQSVLMLQAYKITMDEHYLDGAQSNLDYVLGRNATGYSFVTGFGSKPPMDPHHRQSAADNVAAPVPGMLVGGPHNGQQDGCSYPSNQPAKSYVDDWCSYATNEVTINWNAPLAYVAGAIDYFRSGLVETSQEINREQPQSVLLSQNYPNPFNPLTVIGYQLPVSSDVSLKVYDMLGRELAILVEGRQYAGTYQAEFDASNLASGVYLYRLTVGQIVQARQMVLVK